MRTIFKGLVIKSTGNFFLVACPDNKKISCTLKGQFRIMGLRSTNPVAIGDFVDIELSTDEQSGVVVYIHDRINYIIRKATRLSKVTHIIAANLDHAYLIATLAFPRTSTGFIDRFLVTATGYHIPASIIFNKIDLYDTALSLREEELRRIYTQAGYSCYSVSALRGDYLQTIRDLLQDKTSLFTGHSGAGKSALINAIEPGLELKTGEISDFHHKGKHTTTFPGMFQLSNGGNIVDSPGIKEFGLIDFEKAEIPRCFPEMERFLPYCQFRNCMHTHEPGCAVKAAIGNGEVSELRYQSYLSILND